MLYGNLIPVEMMEPPEPPEALHHINDLAVKTAEAIAAVELRRDKYHRRIAVAADYLVKQERGNLRYGGQYQTGATIWMNEAGEGEIVTPPQEVTLWIV
jgi:hypothetical protein